MIVLIISDTVIRLVVIKNAFLKEGIKHNDENYSTGATCFELRDIKMFQVKCLFFINYFQ